MPYCPIVSTLGYVLSPDRTQVLLTHRVSRRGDEQYGKYNGLGGRMEPNEDVGSCMVREIREEAGIEVTSMCLRGTVNWTGFGPSGQDWLGFVFLILAFSGTPRRCSEEGPLVWVPVAGICALPMWAGDRHFLPLVFDADPRPFHGYLPYAGDRPLGWSFVRF
ncbi:MAG: 8-oxo-dGTP diphosphatase [Lentisphaeria bacterium]|nr:8-oxo-dGTP diphosphatase [Lentisphaeria bacterium]